MQIVSRGDNLHEIPNHVFWKNSEKYHQFVFCWICPEWHRLSISSLICSVSFVIIFSFSLSFGASGRGRFIIVAFHWYLHIFFAHGEFRKNISHTTNIIMIYVYFHKKVHTLLTKLQIRFFFFFFNPNLLIFFLFLQENMLWVLICNTLERHS